VNQNLVIIPAFNEEATIGDTIQSILGLRSLTDIVVINDGSRDRTSEVVRKIGVTVIELPFNLGVGGAIQAGYRYAVQKRYSKVVRFDADGQHNPDILKSIFDELDHYDIVTSTRFLNRNKIYQMGLFRRFSIKVLSSLVSKIGKTKFTDVTNGLRGVKGKALLYYSEYFPTEYLGDTVDSLALGLKQGFTATEISSVMNVRIGGKPSQSYLKLIYNMLRCSISLMIILTEKRSRI
jgi:glycosyltransferase involved in cell wall biosynthesis